MFRTIKQCATLMGWHEHWCVDIPATWNLWSEGPSGPPHPLGGGAPKVKTTFLITPRCYFIFLLLFSPKCRAKFLRNHKSSDITTDWTQKQTYESSCLLRSQILKPFKTMVFFSLTYFVLENIVILHKGISHLY